MKKQMQIVIEIPDGCYEELNSGRFPVQDAYRLVAWIKNGTPLPKGHGRIVDVNTLDETIMKMNENGAQITRNDYKLIDNVIFEMPTIIEADRSED